MAAKATPAGQISASIASVVGRMRQGVLYCDACLRPIAVGEFRSRCTECLDYDLCEQCTTSGSDHPSQLHEHPLFREQVHASLAAAVRGPTPGATIRNALTVFANRPMIGHRMIVDRVPLGPFHWITFGEFGERASAVGAGLRRLGIPRGSFVGLCAGNCAGWYACDVGCTLQGIRIAPMHVPWEPATIKHVLNLAHVVCVIANESVMPNIKKAGGRSVRWLITLSDDNIGLQDCEAVDCDEPHIDDGPVHSPENAAALVQHRDIVEMTIGQVEALGRRWPLADCPQTTDNELFTLNFTSGSTSQPRAAMVSCQVFNNEVAPRLGFQPLLTTVDFSFEPLAHSSRLNELRVFSRGGRVGMFSGRFDYLWEDVRLLAPTHLAAVPRVWNDLLFSFRQRLGQGDDDARAELLRTMREEMGGRVRNIVTGGAPTPPPVFRFLRDLFGVSLAFMSNLNRS